MAHKVLYLVLNIFLLYRSSIQESCNKALGLEDGRIPDERISASSEHNQWHGVKYIRLNKTRNAKIWCPKTSSIGEYIQVDLGTEHAVTGIATYGRNHNWLQYVVKYYIAYGLDGKTFSNYTDANGNTLIFQGNKEVYRHKKFNPLDPHVSARFVRVYPVSWKRKLCMYMELYGCQANNCSINNGNCSEKCTQINDFETQCSCHKRGYKLVDGVCKDINECLESKRKPCAQNCVNTDGNFTCSCNTGYSLGDDGASCHANNCSINNGNCSEKCTQINDFETQCSCHKRGYKLVDGVCKDINECLESKRKPCAQNCVNTDGNFTCSCNTGYSLGDDGASCHDINECRNHTCDQKCVNTPGSFRCECKHGYEFGSDNKSCIDVNECERDISGCDHNCTNTVGSYQCSCRSGYELKWNQRSCKDVDECDRKLHSCSQICDNTIGSYTCRCRLGFVRSEDGRGCDDINECTEKTSGCSHTCVNNVGSYACTCPGGYKLNFDGKTCEDVNECHVKNGNCDDICHNIDGSYKCSCFAGSKLKSDGHSCEDIDECLENPCDLSSTICTNTNPSYRCDCKKGFEPKPNSAASCELVKCGALPTSSKFTVSPSRCSKSDSNLFGQTCSLTCAKGYEAVDPSLMVVRCLANRQWSNQLTQCQGVQCPAIVTPANAELIPKECSSGIRYPLQCTIRCNDGYHNKGPSSVTCQSDGLFSVSKVSDLRCVKESIAPAISCPPGITAVLPKGRNSMTVADKWKDAYSNVGTIRSSHDKNYEFKVGKTTVTFTATTADGQSDKCTIRVNIEDNERPASLYCPGEQKVLITSANERVEWPEPQFTDNVGVVSVTSNLKFGVYSANDYEIRYTAKDEAKNSRTCSFKLIVRDKQCLEDDLNVGSGIAKFCTGVLGGSVSCSVTCLQGKVILRPLSMPWFWCISHGDWLPKENLPVPDCVGYVEFVDKCPNGTFELETSGKKVCANCPLGTNYQNGRCEECPVGFYQNREKQFSCLKCSVGNGTEKTGAKECKRSCNGGTYSATGFPGKQPCTYCPVGTYQPHYGMKSCINCPTNTSTFSIGTIEKKNCGRRGEITLTPSSTVAIVENNDVMFSCKSTALPYVTIQWKKSEPVDDGFGGKVTQTDIIEDNRLVGKSFKITKASYLDRGVYTCETQNRFGHNQKSLDLDVSKDFSK